MCVLNVKGTYELFSHKFKNFDLFRFYRFWPILYQPSGLILRRSMSCMCLCFEGEVDLVHFFSRKFF